MTGKYYLLQSAISELANYFFRLLFDISFSRDHARPHQLSPLSAVQLLTALSTDHLTGRAEGPDLTGCQQVAGPLGEQDKQDETDSDKWLLLPPSFSA